ncbi:MAG: hypothetical protein R3C05_08515 [Pirellulaceae bacterium]
MVNSLGQFLEMLAQRNIRLQLKDGRLSCNAAPGSLTPELLEELRQRKPQLTALLGTGESTSFAGAILRHRGSESDPPPRLLDKSVFGCCIR